MRRLAAAGRAAIRSSKSHASERRATRSSGARPPEGKAVGICIPASRLERCFTPLDRAQSERSSITFSVKP